MTIIIPDTKEIDDYRERVIDKSLKKIRTLDEYAHLRKYLDKLVFLFKFNGSMEYVVGSDNEPMADSGFSHGRGAFDVTLLGERVVSSNMADAHRRLVQVLETVHAFNTGGGMQVFTDSKHMYNMKYLFVDSADSDWGSPKPALRVLESVSLEVDVDTDCYEGYPYRLGRVTRHTKGNPTSDQGQVLLNTARRIQPKKDEE